MQHSVVKKSESLRACEANALQHEIREAHGAMQSCFREMERVLASSSFDAGALTSVRLKLASIRLTRGPLIMRVAEVLAGNVTDFACNRDCRKASNVPMSGFGAPARTDMPSGALARSLSE